MTLRMLAGLILFTASSLTWAQSHPTKAEYQRIFSDAIAKSLPTGKDNVCLPQMYYWTPSGTVEISQQIIERSQGQITSQAAQLRALEIAGLLASTTFERQLKDRAEPFVRYTRTTMGERYFSNNSFCYARAELNKVVKWRGPAVLGEYQAAWVYFTVKMANVADWVRNPAVLASFPTARANLQEDPNRVRSAVVDLTSEGWEVNGDLSRNVQ